MLSNTPCSCQRFVDHSTSVKETNFELAADRASRRATKLDSGNLDLNIGNFKCSMKSIFGRYLHTIQHESVTALKMKTVLPARSWLYFICGLSAGKSFRQPYSCHLHFFCSFRISHPIVLFD